jgi:hypothetical protein
VSSFGLRNRAQCRQLAMMLYYVGSARAYLARNYRDGSAAVIWFLPTGNHVIVRHTQQLIIR